MPGPGAAAQGAPAAAGRPNDSVDVLLEGIPGGPPQARARTSPQSDGQASAAYHAEHAVRPAQTSPDELPKVVVDRAQPGPTLRLQRAKLVEAAAVGLPVETIGDAAGDAGADAAGDVGGAQERAMEPTVVAPPAMGPRIVVATAAGVIVVLALFVGLKMMSAKSGAEAEEPGVSGVTGVTGVSGVTGATPETTSTGATLRTAGAVTAGATATAMPTAAAEPPAMAEPTAASTALDRPAGAPRHAHARAAASAHSRPKPASSAAPGGNLGEFKTTF